jgi:hypothetical protein
MLSTHLRLGLPSGLFHSGFPTNIPRDFFTLHSCYMPCPPHPPWLNHSNYTRSGWRVQVQINSAHFKRNRIWIAETNVPNTHLRNQPKWRERSQRVNFWKHIITLREFHNTDALCGRRDSTGFKSASSPKIWHRFTTSTQFHQAPYSVFSAICATICWFFQAEMWFVWTICKCLIQYMQVCVCVCVCSHVQGGKRDENNGF